MARKVFYSFHYSRDISRVMTVRNRWVTWGGQVASDIIDKAEFESIKRKGNSAVEKWIDNQMEGTSVTVVLIGTETLNRPFVQYEIKKSIEKGNGIIGVKINSIRNLEGNISNPGNIHTQLFVNGSWKPFSLIADSIYDYNLDDGYHNLGEWVELAAQRHGK